MSAKKRIFIVVAGVLVVISALAGIKALQIRKMIDQGKKMVPPPEIVTTAAVRRESWETVLAAVGSLSAVQGVTVSAELAGKVAEIAFEPGGRAEKGDLLIRQDAGSEEAQLPGAVAQVNFAKAVLERNGKMLAEKIISRAEYDASVAAHEQAVAQADLIRTTIGKKTIRAPFTGRIGIRQVNLGQNLREGDPVVTLQSLDPIYVDFSLPQQEIGRLRNGLPVRVTCDALPGVTVNGRITAINPLVDAETRNIRLQATASNPTEKLRPGMFVNVAVGLPVRRKVLAIPATAVLYAPYGDSVFVVEDAKDGKGGKVLRQQIVRLGERRGDFVAVAQGLDAGDHVVSTGVFKLRNGQAAAVDNRLSPKFEESPKPENK